MEEVPFRIPKNKKQLYKLSRRNPKTPVKGCEKKIAKGIPLR